MDLKEIGNRIRERRMYLGYRQEEVAQMIHTSRSNFARYEAGDVDLNISTMEALCKALRVPMSYFLPDDDADLSEDENEIVSSYRGVPPTLRPQAKAILKAFFKSLPDPEPTTHGNKAE